MALLFTDGFDTYSLFSQKYDLVNMGLSSTTTTGARNGQCAQMTGSGVQQFFGKNFGAKTTLITGFAFYVGNAATPSPRSTIVSFVDGGTIQVSLEMNATGNFQFYRNSGATALGSASSASLSFNAWHYIEVKVTIDGSAGVCELKVDGNFWLQLSSQNTKATSNAYASQVVWGLSNQGNECIFRFDDLYVVDTSGSNNTTYLGDVKVVGVLPNGNGTVNNFSQTGASFVANAVMALGQQLIDSNGALQRVTAITSDDKVGASAPTWSTTVGGTTTSNHVTFTLIQKAALSNFNFVNEQPPDDDNSYVSDGTLNDIERYIFPAQTGAVVKAVAINARMKKDSSGARSIRTVAHSGGSDGDNGADLPLAQTVYTNYQGILETDPNTGSPWSVSAVNTAEFGVKITV